ncbi:MAG TPA: hypothetical protein VFJ18_12590 [Pararhizobium sp.]|nr:hypothetical protein [Pararhizobium sp.]
MIVAPITHRPASDPTDSIAVPSEVCRLLGLDGEAQWLRTDELNSFSWPGFDLRPIPGRATVEYGMLPRDLFHQLRSKILQRQKEKKLNTPVDRD